MTFNQTNNNKGDVNNAVATNGNATQTVRNTGEVEVSNNSVNTGGGSIDNRGGSFTQARDITHSFNTATAGATNQEVVAKLKQLAETLNDILANLPADVAERVSKDYETFAKEAADKVPRSAILTALKDGLLATLGVAWKAAVPVITPLLTGVIAAAVA